MRQTLKARITYKSDYRGQEGYLIEINTDGEWCMNSFFPLVRRENANQDEEKNFIHFSMINGIAELNSYGYQISFL